MSFLKLQASRYYRLSKQSDVEVTGVVLTIDVSLRTLTVYCNEIERERIFWSQNTQDYPKMIFQNAKLYVMFSSGMSDGFSLRLDENGKQHFMSIMKPFGCVQEYSSSSNSTTTAPSPLPTFNQPPAAVYSDFTPMYIPGHNPYATSAPPDPRYYQFDNKFSQPYLPSFPQQFNPMVQSQTVYSPAFSTASYRASPQVPPLPPPIPECFDKEVQTDDLEEFLLNDDALMEECLKEMMKSDDFVSLVVAMRNDRKESSKAEQRYIQRITDPNFVQSTAPPELVTLDTTEMDKND